MCWSLGTIRCATGRYIGGIAGSQFGRASAEGERIQCHSAGDKMFPVLGFCTVMC